MKLLYLKKTYKGVVTVTPPLDILAVEGLLRFDVLATQTWLELSLVMLLCKPPTDPTLLPEAKKSI